jgi:uncharacterized membrane protein HdeD (DUF308 family)
LVLGIYQLYSGFVNSSKIKNSALLKINGVAAAVIGLILLFKPGMVASFVVQLLGVISILIGGIMMYFAILIKNASKVEEAVIVKETTKEESQAEGETLSEEAAEEK